MACAASARLARHCELRRARAERRLEKREREEAMRSWEAHCLSANDVLCAMQHRRGIAPGCQVGAESVVLCCLPATLASRYAMPSRSDPATYSISELAREFALTTRAIRFYEDEG